MRSGLILDIQAENLNSEKSRRRATPTGAALGRAIAPKACALNALFDQQVGAARAPSWPALSQPCPGHPVLVAS